MTVVRDLAATNRALESRAREWRRAALLLVGAGAFGVLAVAGGAFALRHSTPEPLSEPARVSVSVERTDLHKTVRAVWGDSLEAYAVGDDGFIAHHDPASGWHAVRSPTHATLRAIAVWGAGDGRVGFAVGDGGTILRYSGATRSWSVEPSGTKEDLYGVATLEPIAVTVGAHGTLLLREAWGNTTSEWTRVAAPNVTLRAAYVPVRASQSAGPVYAVGDDGTILSRSFTDLTPIHCEQAYENMCTSNLATYRPRSVLSALRLAAWNEQDSGTRVSLRAVGGSGADVFVGGDDGTLLHTNVQSGTVWAAVPTETHDAFVSIASEETIGATASGLLFSPRHDALRWGGDLSGVARAYDGDVFVAERNGVVTHVARGRR